MKKYLFLSCAVFCALSAHAKTLEIHLQAKPEFSEEGVHIQESGEIHSMYAVNASEKVIRAFSKAKKGQCLRLEVTSDFDFTDASGIKSVRSCAAKPKNKAGAVNVSACVDKWIDAHRKAVKDPEAIVRSDMVDEWESWCKKGKLPK